jgi:hypothetical protein
LYGTDCAYRANVNRFETYCRRKEEAALAASLSGFYTVKDSSSGRGLIPIGNSWTRRLFDGDFYRCGGRHRHPAQIVVTDRGDLPFDRGLMFAEPTLRVFVVTGSRLAGQGPEAGVRFEHFLVAATPV